MTAARGWPAYEFNATDVMSTLELSPGRPRRRRLTAVYPLANSYANTAFAVGAYIISPLNSSGARAAVTAV